MIGRFETFTLSLSEILSNWNKIATEEMKAYGLKGPSVVYLIVLFKYPDGLTAAELCKLCNRDKAEVSRTISTMEKKGLVTRVPTTVSGYRANVSLTEAGNKLALVIRERIKLAVEKGGAGLTEQQIWDFYSSLEIICKNLRKISEEGL